MNWNEMNQSDSDDSNSDSPAFLNKQANKEQSKRDNQKQSQQPIDRMNNRRKYRDNPTPAPSKKEQKQTVERERKFLSDQEVLKQIQDGTIKQNKSIKIVNCKLDALKDMLKQDKAIDLREFKQHCYYANFKRKEDLLSFIRKKIQNKYKFFIHPIIKKSFRKESENQERNQNRYGDKKQQKLEKQTGQFEPDHQKLFHRNKNDLSFFWKNNQFIIATVDASVKELMKSLQNRKVIDQFNCIKITVKKDTIDIGFQFAEAVYEKYNWKNDSKKQDIVRKLESQNQAMITLKQGIKRKEIKEQTHKQNKQQKRQIQKYQDDKYAKKKYVNKYQETGKFQEKAKKQLQKESFSLKQNLIFIYEKDVKKQDVVKAIKDSQVTNGFITIKVNVTKDLVNAGFQVAEAIKDTLGWAVISTKENTLNFLQRHPDADILIKQLTNKKEIQIKVANKKQQNQAIIKPISYVKEEKGVGFEWNTNTLHILSEQASIKQISRLLEKNKVLKQYAKIRIKTPKKLIPVAYKVVDNFIQLFGIVEQQNRIKPQQSDNVVQIYLKVIQKKANVKKVYVSKNSEVSSSAVINPATQLSKQNIMMGKSRKINSNSDSFFQELNSTNITQIVQKIDQKEYCEKFRKHINQIFEKYECWILQASNQLIENLLKVSWKLQKYIQVDIKYRVSRQNQTSKAFVDISVSEKVLAKEKGRQDRPKVDTSYINSYLTNT